jgi:hypothetical protein
MRVRPQALLTAMAAATLLLAGCDEALVEAKASSKAVSSRPISSKPVSSRLMYGAPDRSSAQQPQLVDLLLQAITARVAPAALPSAGFDALQARVQRATNEAAANGATLSVAILDRATHQLISNGNSEIVGTASVAKLFIADEVLMQESDGNISLSANDRQALDTMLRSSDDGAAENFWNQDGGGAIINQVATRYGLTSTNPPSDGRWWNTVSSVDDLIHYYDVLLDGSGGLPEERANLIVNDLAQSTPNGIDGYPQRFGIPEALYAEPVAVKQGWMCCVGSAWVHLSTGVIGAERRYVMVVQSLQTTDDATARETITQAVKTIFPNGRI